MNPIIIKHIFLVIIILFILKEERKLREILSFSLLSLFFLSSFSLLLAIHILFLNIFALSYCSFLLLLFIASILIIFYIN